MDNKVALEIEERDYYDEILAIIKVGGSDGQLRERLEKYHANDIAGVLSELSDAERERLYEALGNETMSEIVSYLEDAGEYLAALDVEDAADIIGQMDASEALEALDGLDEETRSAVLEHIEDEEIKEDIELIGSYEDDEFGSRMSTNFISVRRGMSVKEATKALISEAAQNDNIYTLFVTEDNGTFYGAIDLKDLIVAMKLMTLSKF